MKHVKALPVLPSIPLLLTYLLIVLSYSAANAQELSSYLIDRHRVAVTEYFAKMTTFATFRNRGQRPGDFYALPTFDLTPRRDVCFPGLDTSPPLRQNFNQPEQTFEINLAGLLSADAGDYVKGEINGKVKLYQRIKGTIENIEAEISDKALLESHVDASACPAGQMILYNAGDGKHILIKDVYFVEGRIDSIYALEISGSLEVEVTTVLNRLFSVLGLGELRISGKVEGGLTNKMENQFALRAEVPAAFVPFFINGQDLERTYTQYIENGYDQSLGTALKNDADLRSLFEQVPELEQETQTTFESLARDGELVAFNPENKIHVRYLQFKANLNIAREIMDATRHARDELRRQT